MADKQITNEDFTRLVTAVEHLAARDTINAVIKAQPLGEDALRAGRRYSVIAANLRTVFEAIPDSTLGTK